MSSSTIRFLFFIRSFDLKGELVKGTQVVHAHVFLDKDYQKGFQGAFKGLSRGKHQITVTGATKDLISSRRPTRSPSTCSSPPTDDGVTGPLAKEALLHQD
jgi:hypothetical protein